MNNLKIAYITMQFPVPSETFATNDVRALRKLGAEISVYGLRSAHPEMLKLLKERDLEDLIPSHKDFSFSLKRLKLILSRFLLLLDLYRWIVKVNWRRPEHLIKSLFLMSRSLEIFEQLNIDKPDVVHIYWGHYPSMVGYLVKRYMPNIPITISLVAYDLEMGYEGTKWLVHYADKIRTLADINVARINELYNVPESQIEVIYDGVDIARLTPYLAEQNVPKRLISVGRLVGGKGMSDVLNIFAAIVSHHTEASLVILGDGPERTRFENQCSELGIAQSVVFAGHVNHDQVLQEMAKADLFIFMSKKKAERLPNVVKEAMLAECICIVSNTMGIEELIPDEHYGFVVPMGDVEAAIEHALQALDPAFEGASVQASAKRHIVENFDLESSANQYLTMWQQIVRSKSKL